MTKAFFYETEGGTLHRCMFAELDGEDQLMFDKITQMK